MVTSTKRLTALALAASAAVLAATPQTSSAATTSASASPYLATPAAHAGETAGVVDPDKYLGNFTTTRPTTFMVGDSITYRAWAGPLKTKAPSWEVTAIGGRKVSTLPFYVSDRLANPSRVKVAVIALGTNPATGWTKADYQAQVDRFPSTTRVVFVTPYRGPKWAGASTVGTYAKWMNEIDAARPNVCMARWRAWAVAHPRAISDGIHPTGTAQQVWVKLVTDAATYCR